MRKGKFKKSAFLVAGMMVVNLGVSGAASAANGWEIDLSAGYTSVATATDATVQLNMGGKEVSGTLDAGNAANNPDEAGKVLTEMATVTVENSDSYTVMISGNEDLTGRSNPARKISGVASDKTLGSMKNEWGYYSVFGDDAATWNPNISFSKMTNATVGSGTAQGKVTKKITLFYGARVDDTIPEDFYGNTVTLSVVAEPGTIMTDVNAKFGGITTMQEMTYALCQAASVNDTAYLKDERDGKYYWVAKMGDNNCWMTQNLELDLEAGKTLLSADSDMSSNWTPSYSTATKIEALGASDSGTYSWNLGKYVLNTSGTAVACADNNTGLSACVGSGFVKVAEEDGWTASTDPNFYRKTSYAGKNGASCTKTANSALNAEASEDCRVYDAHYLVGNYYQWNAAVAGTASQAGDVLSDAPKSICPKGWRPAENYNSAAGSSYPLLSSYGLTSTTTGVSGNYNYNVALSPLFLVRAGAVNPQNGMTYNVGSEGFIWSTTGPADKTTGVLYFGTSATDWSKFMARWYGFSLRCKAMGTRRPIVGG